MAIFIVTNTADTGAGSLRDALAQAQANGSGADEIVFDASLAGQTVTLASKLEITQGTVSISGDFDGDSDPDVTISGANVTSILDIAAGSDVTLNALVLRDGLAIGAEGPSLSDTDGESVAGAIHNRGTLAVNYSVLASNAATGGDGSTEIGHGGDAAGAILNGGQLTVSESVFRDNQADGGDGSFYFDQDGGDGGDAAGGILNLAGATMSLDIVNMETSVGSTGGDGGNGDRGVAVGYDGGDGGHGAALVLNLGTIDPGQGAQVITSNGAMGAGGTGGTGGFPTAGDFPGAPGIPGSSGDSVNNGSGTLTLRDDLGTEADEIVTGITSGNSYFGLGGDDQLSGDGAMLHGGAGDDILTGGTGADTLDGGTNGAAGDTVSYAGSAAGVRVFLESGMAASSASGGDAENDVLIDIEHLVGSANNDVLIGNDEDNILTGGDGVDEMGSGRGDDTLIGGNGTDVLVGGEGADDLQGGDGFDIAFYLGSSAGVTINLANGTATGGEAEGDIFDSVETIIASAHDDTIVGSASANTFIGRDGSDTFVGSAAGDIIIGGISAFVDGTGIDTMDYSSEVSAITVNFSTFSAQGASIGSDQLYGIERVLGTSAGDNLRGNELGNTIEGGGGADLLNGAGGEDVIIGGAGGDVMIGGGGDDVFRLSSSDGNDIVRDFDLNGDDVLEFHGFGPDFDFSDITLTLVNQSDVFVTATGWSGNILLQNSAGQVDAGDFVFG